MSGDGGSCTAYFVSFHRVPEPLFLVLLLLSKEGLGDVGDVDFLWAALFMS